MMGPDTSDRDGGTVATTSDTPPATPIAGTASPESPAARAHALARASHLLKAPLAVIKGSATTLLSGQWDASTQQELLGLIDTQTDHLLRLLDGLLAVWRMEAGQVALRLAPARVATLLGDLAARWAATQPAHALRLELPSDLPTMTLDAERLLLTLDHLLRFVARQTPGDAPLGIAARATDDTVTLLVTAPGVTLSPDARARLFEPLGGALESLEPRDPRDHEARDDLALVRAVIHAHGGHAAAEPTRDGSGLLVRLVLPINAARAATTATAPSALAWSAPGGGARRDPRQRPVVLVAESDARLARLVRANLEAQGYRALVADDARRLARLWDQEDPDLVLLDTHLDTRLGEPATGETSLWTGHGAAPVIVLGAGEEAECVYALDRGAVDYLAKPFGLGELLARVRAALRTTAREREVGAWEPPFRSGDLTIDNAQRLVRMGERPIQLSRTEYKLLRALAQHAGRVLAHEQLLERVWGPGYGAEVEFLWVYVRRLRRKIEPDPRHPAYILTVPGVGYRLARL